VLLPCWEGDRAKHECFAWSSGKLAKHMSLDRITFTPAIPLSTTPPWRFPSVSVDNYFWDKTQAFKDIDNMAGMVEDRLETAYLSFIPAWIKRP